MQTFPIIKFLYTNIYGDSKRGSMETTHEVITRLKFIGLIKKGEKISVKSLSVHQTSLFTSLYRMFNQESRESTLDFLTSTVNRAFEIIQLCISSNKSSDKTICKNLCEDLVNTLTGLVNLQTTYGEDRLFWCHIQTLIQAIQVKLSELRDTNPEFFQTESEAKENNKIEFNLK
jgi:hypothetical protein